MSLNERNRSDACPGALRLHDAADGALARVRIPGGRVAGAQMRALVGLAVEHGDGNLDLTSRGNVQIRGLRPDAAPALAEELHRVGLLPSAPHERVRNIQSSPLAGLDGRGCGPLDDLVAALDDAVCAEPRLAELSGRYLWALDDGRGDVAGGADACWLAESPGHGRLVLAGTDTGIRVARREAVEVLLCAALRFLESGAGWRLSGDLGLARRVAASVLRGRPHLRAAEAQPLPRCGPAAVGPVRTGGLTAAVVAAVPLGRLSPEQGALLAELASADPVRLTPWRSVVVPGSAQGLVTQGGLVCASNSAWPGITACVGMPACAKALADVRTEARQSAQVLPSGTGVRRRAVHWSGCERRCGRPEGGHVEAVALPGGDYAVSDARTRAVLPAGRAAAHAAALRENPTTL